MTALILQCQVPWIYNTYFLTTVNMRKSLQCFSILWFRWNANRCHVLSDTGGGFKRLESLTLVNTRTWVRSEFLTAMCAKKEYVGVEAWLHSFLTSALYTGKQSATSCSHFNPKNKSSCTHWKELDGPETWTRCFGAKKHLLLQLGSESQLQSHPARSLDIKHPCRGPIKFVLATIICKFASCGSKCSVTHVLYTTYVREAKPIPSLSICWAFIGSTCFSFSCSFFCCKLKSWYARCIEAICKLFNQHQNQLQLEENFLKME